jgi:GxxExxY protein
LGTDKRIGKVSEKRLAPVPHKLLTYRIIGAAMRVHNELGPGLKEAMYQRGLSLALEEDGLSFEAEKPLEVRLDGSQVGLLYLDHFVEGSIIVEEKALSHLLRRDEVAQVITYLAVSNAPVGLLINFGRKRLEYKRILPPTKFADWRRRAARYVWQPSQPANAYPFIRSSSVDRSSRPV